MNSIEFVFAMSMSQKETASLSIRLYSSSLSRHSSSRHAFSPLDLDDLHDKTVSSKSNARLIMVFGCVVLRNQKMGTSKAKWISPSTFATARGSGVQVKTSNKNAVFGVL